MIRGVVEDDCVIDLIKKELLPDDASITDCVRLLVYLDYCVKNCGVVNLISIGNKEVHLIEYWNKKGFIEVNNSSYNKDETLRVCVSKKMYDIMCRVLWEAYVEKI